MPTNLPTTNTVPIRIAGFELAEADRDLDPNELERAAPIWRAATVPGGVHESLLAAGVIADPYVDRNEDSIRWMEERDWWYRTTFAKPADQQPGERIRLLFHGLDTVVTIWLNGELLGHHENQFRPAEFDVTDLLVERNQLLLRFSPPLAGVTVPPSVALEHRLLAKIMTGEVPFGGTDISKLDLDLTSSEPAAPGMSPMLLLSTARRKAIFSWGWDFGPRVPSIGIWQPVELVRETSATIVGHHVSVTELADDRRSARVGLLVQTRGAVDGLTARVTLTSPSGNTHTHEFAFEGHEASASVVLDNPELWWTHDLGTPNLYDVLIETILVGEVVATLADRIGLRTIRLDQQADGEGSRLFRLILNDFPIFARGASWVPASMLVGSVSDDRYHDLVSLARDGNMNMIRIWGGGVYELDPFYRETDAQGVLVWQDFMFACTDYPSADAALQAEVQAEATFQVRRLRNRASIGLWCGNNEVQMIHGFSFGNYEPDDWGWDFFNRILPDTVASEDGTVPYWPGSPFGENTREGFAAVNGVLDGDRHAWEVWHGGDVGAGGGPFDSVGEARHFRRYANDTGKFISEFGIHASPELGTLERWIPAAELTIHSESFDDHNKDHPKDKHDALLEIVTGLPATMDEYVQFTMVSQAEGLKFGIEHYRRRQPHCSGTLIWQLNDVWPGFSWSVIDYDLVPKAGYYFAKRVFAPVLASFKPVVGAPTGGGTDGAPDAVELWVSNSAATALETTATISRVGLDGRVVASEQVAVRVEAGGSASFWSGPIGAGEILWVDAANGAFPSNRYFTGDVKDLAFDPHSLDYTITSTGPNTAEIATVSSGYNYLTHVVSPVPGIRFSDNYFELRDGERRTITVNGLPDGFDAQRLVVAGYVG